MFLHLLVWAGVQLSGNVADVTDAGTVAVEWLGEAAVPVSYSEDPNIRMNQLLHEEDDPRKISYEWKRIWFTDQPSHLTPERVHGGIQ